MSENYFDYSDGEINKTVDFETCLNEYLTQYRFSSQEVDYLEINQSDILSFFPVLKKKFNYVFLVDFFLKELSSPGVKANLREIVFIFKNFTNGKELILSTYLTDSFPFMIVQELWPNFERYAREVYDYLDEKFILDDKKYLLHKGDESFFDLNEKKISHLTFDERKRLYQFFPKIDSVNISNNSKDIFYKTTKINSFFSNGLFNSHTELVDSRIRRIFIEIGYFHRDVEKICQNLPLVKVFPLVERLNLSCGFIYSMGLYKTLEECSGVTVPDRAQALRMAFSELVRIYSHLLCLREIFFFSKQSTPHSICHDLVLELCHLFEYISGNRHLLNFNTYGGVKKDLPTNSETQIIDKMKKFDKEIFNLMHLSVYNRSWSEELRYSEFSPEFAIEEGFTGPILRSCGINLDQRKDDPYYFYPDVEFEVPLGVCGNNYDRIFILFEEILQSISIVIQIFDNLPKGHFCNQDFSIENIKHLYESQALCLNDYIEKVKFPLVLSSESGYKSLEGPTGLISYYFNTNDSKTFSRLRVRTPGFSHCLSLQKVLRGHLLEEASLTIRTFNLNTGEIDK